VEKASQAIELEYVELAGDMDRLAERAPVIPAEQLVEIWPTLEERVLERVSADGYDDGHATGDLASVPRLEGERIRNLAWEIGVSVDLHAVHLGALRALGRLLRERSQRFANRGSRNRSRPSYTGSPGSNPG